MLSLIRLVNTSFFRKLITEYESNEIDLLDKEDSMLAEAYGIELGLSGNYEKLIIDW